MDSSLTVKPRDRFARTVVGRSNSVRTDLSPSQSVNAGQQGSASHHTPDMLTRDPSIDAQCHTVLDRDREERERRRARKDEVLLRHKAYGRNTEKPEAPQDDAPHADFQV